MPDIDAATAALAAAAQQGPGDTLRIVLLISMVGGALLAWFLLRGYGSGGTTDETTGGTAGGTTDGTTGAATAETAGETTDAIAGRTAAAASDRRTDASARGASGDAGDANA
ncbi:hypothetical protein ACFYOG_24400 [Streptomyces sp. NPDC007818]|uniref:hypothetical protein n=1 Tax=Streptomyces sp. NPDC007818 TaxID=3364780 RepID=UPI0036BF9142